MIPPGRVHISPWLVITSSPRRWRVQLGVVLGQRAHFPTPSGGVAEVDQAHLETSISSALPLLITSRRTGAPPALTSASLNSGIVSTRDRKSTRLNSSHVAISYAVFCLKKKNYR